MRTEGLFCVGASPDDPTATTKERASNGPLDGLSLARRIFTALVVEGGPPDRLMIDATHLKAHRTASSLLKGGMFPALLAVQRAV